LRYDALHDTLCVMREVTAAELRQAMGKVAKRLERTGEPVLLTLGNKPVGVIVSMKDFEERFALHDAAQRRQALMQEILEDRVGPSTSVDTAILELRKR
jgi:prevent-host-death family protein